MILTGGCKYCGQIVSFDAPEGREYTAADCDTIASNRCECVEAKRERILFNSIKEGQKSIDLMFDSDDEIRNTLKDIVKLVCREQLMNVSFKLDDRTKVGIKLNSKGKLRIDKTITSSEAKEI